MSCQACGKKTVIGLCSQCLGSIFPSFQAKCPKCHKIGQARPGFMTAIELSCGHSLTIVNGAGFIAGDATSIKSKV